MEKNIKKKRTVTDKKLTRRNLLKMGGLGVAATVAAGVAKRASAADETLKGGEISLKGKKLAMVLDLQRCTGCGGCTIACMNENNIQSGVAWSYMETETKGKFPNVRYTYKPTLCNHCVKAPCVKICPSGAMHKIDGNITMHDPSKCVGCKSCIAACPYPGTISRNSKKTHPFWRSNKPLIDGCTESAEQVVKDVKGNVTPYYNPDREKNVKGSGLRQKGIVEKCTFCDHRVKRGKLPYCVLRCPASARIFGDLNDPKSKVNEIIGKYKASRRKEHLGTESKVYYVRDYNAGSYQKSRGSV